jgi:hypothetical protein
MSIAEVPENPKRVRRLDTDNWTGHRFTDFFNLVKFNGQWKVVSKVFYLHP